jgi:dihydrolipoamide dehydrogenase
MGGVGCSSNIHHFPIYTSTTFSDPYHQSTIKLGETMTDKLYDLAIIGGGPGGYVAALRAAQGGLSTVLIEKEAVGGMCLNWGCIPSKSLISSTILYEKMLKAEKYGLTGVDFKAILPDWGKMNNYAQSVVQRLTRGVKALLDKNGVEIILGTAEVQDKQSLKVNEQTIRFKNLIIATGSHYPLPDFVKDEANFYTPRTIYGIQKLPETLTIIGAGVVGVEFALLFASLGVKVTLLEKHKELMSYMDIDLIASLKLTLKKNKVKLITEANAVKYDTSGLTIKKGDGTEEILSSDIYLSALPRTANLTGLEALVKSGMELKKGFIRTDLRARTTLPNIFAVGDVNGKIMLAHVASAEGTTAVETILGEGKDLVYDLMPYNLYAKPEFASVGLTQQEAEKRGFLVETGKFPMTANGKALADDSADGFVKVVYDKKYGEILGVHIAADNATDLISESVMAMKVESTVWDVASAVHPHPTFSEAFLEATFKAMKQPLHTL